MHHIVYGTWWRKKAWARDISALFLSLSLLAVWTTSTLKNTKTIIPIWTRCTVSGTAVHDTNTDVGIMKAGDVYYYYCNNPKSFKNCYYYQKYYKWSYQYWRYVLVLIVVLLFMREVRILAILKTRRIDNVSTKGLKQTILPSIIISTLSTTQK